MSTAFEQSLLSFASYAQLSSGGSTALLRAQLLDTEHGAAMTAAQAQLFASQFEVVHQYDGTPSSTRQPAFRSRPSSLRVCLPPSSNVAVSIRCFTICH